MRNKSNRLEEMFIEMVNKKLIMKRGNEILVSLITLIRKEIKRI